MQPEFTHLLVPVLIVGGAIALIAAGLLIVAFRAFAPASGRPRDLRQFILIGAVLGFVMLACVLLFAISLIR
jgi:hypothetical protein